MNIIPLKKRKITSRITLASLLFGIFTSLHALEYTIGADIEPCSIVKVMPYP